MSRSLCLCLLAAALLIRLPDPSTAATPNTIYLPMVSNIAHSGNYIYNTTQGASLGNIARAERTPLLQNTAARSYVNLTWSPDGRWVSAVQKEGSATALVKVDIRTRQVVTLTNSRLPNHPSINGSPLWSSDGRWIAVPATDGVYRVGPSGGALLRLTTQRGALSWSPKGAALVVSNTAGHYLINPDTAKVTHVLAQQGTLSWSPSGTALAITRTDGIHLVNVTTGAAKKLSSLYGSIGWSPDGATLAVSAGGLHLVSAASGTVKQISNFSGTFSWSPDSQFLAFAEEDGLFRIKADGGGRTRLTSFGDNPVWSPNGQLIAFMTSTAPALPPYQRLHLFHVPTLQVEQLYETIDQISVPQWSPDSRWLTYHTQKWDSIKPSPYFHAFDTAEGREIVRCGHSSSWNRAASVLITSCGELDSSGALIQWNDYYNGDMELLFRNYIDYSSNNSISWSPT